MKRMAKRCPFFASTFVLNEVMQVEFFESFEPRFLWLGVVFHSRSQFMELPTVVRQEA